ncbi:MAG: hypothetical protein M3P08_17465, partial [Thermoproteota archaeon]|nr:hypothetical protein [Thermoproteota archaeon]
VRYRTTNSILPPCLTGSSPRYKQGTKRYTIRSISQNVDELRLEDLPEVKPLLITKLNRDGIESVFDLAIAISHEFIENNGIPKS